MSKIYDRISRLLKERNIPLTKLGENIGVSSSSLGRTFREKTLTLEKFEAISEYLNISPAMWWIEDDEVFWADEPRVEYMTSKKQDKDNDFIISNLLNQIEFLNKTISEQTEIIKKLSKKVK